MTTLMEEKKTVEPPAGDAPVKVKETRAATSRRATLGSLFFTFQPLILSAIMIKVTGYVIDTLGQERYGEWAAALTLISLTTTVMSLGLRGPFVRAVAKDNSIAESALADQLGIRLALSLLAGVASILICVAMGYPPIVLLCTAMAAGGILINTVNATLFDLLQGLQKLTAVALLTMCSGVVLTLGSAAFCYSGVGVIGVATAYLVGPTLAMLLTLWVVSRRHVKVRIAWDRKRFAHLLWDARFFAIQNLVASLCLYITPLAVSKFMDLATLGIFNAGMLLADRLTTIPDQLGSAAYSAIAKASSDGDSAILRILRHYLLLSLGLCIAAAITISLLAGPIVALLFHKYPESRVVMQITIWLLPIAALDCIFGYALNALHKDAAQARASFFASIHIVIAILMVWQWGLIGACWALVLRPAIRVLFLLPSTISTFGPMLSNRRNEALKGAVS